MPFYFILLHLFKKNFPTPIISFFVVIFLFTSTSNSAQKLVELSPSDFTAEIQKDTSLKYVCKARGGSYSKPGNSCICVEVDRKEVLFSPWVNKCVEMSDEEERKEEERQAEFKKKDEAFLKKYGPAKESMKRAHECAKKNNCNLFDCTRLLIDNKMIPGTIIDPFFAAIPSKGFFNVFSEYEESPGDLKLYTECRGLKNGSNYFSDNHWNLRLVIESTNDVLAIRTWTPEEKKQIRDWEQSSDSQKKKPFEISAISCTRRSNNEKRNAFASALSDLITSNSPKNLQTNDKATLKAPDDWVSYTLSVCRTNKIPQEVVEAINRSYPLQATPTNSPKSLTTSPSSKSNSLPNQNSLPQRNENGVH